MLPRLLRMPHDLSTVRPTIVYGEIDYIKISSNYHDHRSDAMDIEEDDDLLAVVGVLLLGIDSLKREGNEGTGAVGLKHS